MVFGAVPSTGSGTVGALAGRGASAPEAAELVEAPPRPVVLSYSVGVSVIVLPWGAVVPALGLLERTL